MFENRIAPDSITTLGDNDIFVFGSNLSGRHGRGAAKTALKWGAVYGISVGFSGSTYAIPTKDYVIRNNLSVEKISRYVELFIGEAKARPHLTFLVTEIGCGLAGYHPREIAPLFHNAINVQNIHLPSSFWHYLANI